MTGDDIKPYSPEWFARLKKPRPSVLKELDAQADDRKQLRAWAKQVKDRDGWKCYVCGRFGVEAHHIVKRSQSRALRYELTNGVTLCKRPWGVRCCHRLADRGAIKFWRDARGKLRFEVLE